MAVTNVIEEIQTWLSALSRVYDDIPRVFCDGIYGPETEKAVRAFQRKCSLPPTGKVNYDTFERLLSEYSRIVEASQKPYCILPFTRTARPGEISPFVYILQVMLEELGTICDNIQTPEINGVFDEATERAVKELQDGCGIPATGIVDKLTWDSAALLYNNLKSAELVNIINAV